MSADLAGPCGSEFNAVLGPLPEPRMWYDHATQKCHGMAPTGGTNERLWDACDMQAYAAAAVAAERKRPRQVLAYMATSREGTVRFTDNPDAARELEGYGWAITPLADAGPNCCVHATATAPQAVPERDSAARR